MPPPLKVAFLWHMHQPDYRNPRTGLYALPWVRLHTVKDYHEMVSRLEASPKIKANFNLVPCLVEQIRDYAGGKVKELHLELSRKPAAELQEDEEVSVLRHFFLGNRRTMIEPYPRYRSLLEKCMHLDQDYKVEAAVRRFRRQDFLDLQVWSNLAWMGPSSRRDRLVADLFQKGRNFSESEKGALLDRQMEMMGDVLGKHRSLAAEGRIEISTSPHFHPVIPLLCDSDVARVSSPGIPLPQKRIRFPEDARAQIESGIGLHQEVFGEKPRGMWPPEGGISDETVELALHSGISWIATDEGILQASLGVTLRDPLTGKVKRPDLIYRPHKVCRNGGEIVVLFRDRLLSDLISFGYAELPAKDAVADFLQRLKTIRQDLGGDVAGSLVLLALDGENCWEFYDRGGDRFLKQLYSALSRDPEIETVLLSEVLQGRAGFPEIKQIYPGSWIGSNFATWIGHSEHNRAWDLLYAARTELVESGSKLSGPDRQKAWRSIYAAEGSDWFWWYGGEHVSREDTEFDALFRAHLRNVYELLGAHVPHQVLQPVTDRRRGVAISFEPAAVIKPKLDGRVTTFYEWKLAGLYESYRDSSRTILGSRVLDAVYFGFNHERLYLRLDTSISPQSAEFTHLAFRIEFEDPVHTTISIRAAQPCSPQAIQLQLEPPEAADQITAVALEVVELAIPFQGISAKAGDKVTFRVAVTLDGQLIEHRPVHELIALTLPRPDFEADMWSTL